MEQASAPNFYRAQPISARDGALLYEAGRFFTRHRWGVMAGGAIAGAAGIPLWIVGSKLVPISRDDKAPRPALVPELRVGVTRASLSLSF